MKVFSLFMTIFLKLSLGLSATFTSETPFSSANDWEPYIAADLSPGSNWVYMICTEIASPKVDRRIVLRASPDNGATWLPKIQVCGQNCSSTQGGQADSTIQVSNQGTVFVCWLQGYNPGPVVSRSFDHAKTFTSPTAAWPTPSPGWTDKPWMTISPDGSEVYVSWYGLNGHFIAASLDGGQTFQAPVSLPTNNLYWFPEGGVVSPVTGTVFFSVSAETTSGNGQVLLALHRSDDQGSTWTTQTLATSKQGPPCPGKGCNNDEFQASTALAVDSSGTLMYVYSLTQTSGTAKSIYALTSTDDGQTWQGPSLLYSAPAYGTGGDGGFPAVAAGPTPGSFGVTWQDNRNAPSAWNTFFVSTTDGGNTWSSETRLSNLGANPIYPYKGLLGYQFPYGDYAGLTCNSSGTYFAIWGEGTGRETTGGCWYSFGN